MKKASLFVCSYLLSLGLASCGENAGITYHTVNFNSNGGSPVTSQNVEHGSKAHKPDDPNKPGYEFVTWTYKGEEWSFIGYSVTEDITLDANWSAITYSIEYNLDGGTNNPSNPRTYTADDEYNLYSPTKEGYSFSGWTLNGEQISKISKGTFGNLFLTATWTIGTYNLTVVSSDLTKGTVSGSGTYVYNSSVTVTATANDDYVFLGWFSDELFNDLLSNKSSYTFEMPGHDISIYGYFVSFEELGISFALNDDNQSYTLDRYKPSFTYVREIIIPFCYKGLVVTSIGSYAFIGCSLLTSVTIPDSVTSIGGSAFESCSSLTSITIPDSVTSIGSLAFCGCSSLTSITIPDSVTSIGFSAFSGCSSLTSVTIPDSITSLGDSVFSNCESLLFNKHDNAYYLGNESNPYIILYKAINNSIYSCDVSNKCVIIASLAFCNCSSLTSITIPDSVTSIGNSAFSGCSNLESVTLPFVGGSASASSASSSTLFGYIFGSSSYANSYQQHYSEFYTYYYLPNSLRSVTITGGKLLDAAFYGCSSLTSITIPNSVTSISSVAFCNCSSLTSITIPDSVTSIGSAAFYNCSNLTSITIPNSVTSISFKAFYNCSSLTSITIPDSVTSIGDFAFNGCSNLESITLPFVGGSASASYASSSTLFGYIFGSSSFANSYQIKQYYHSELSHYYYLPNSLRSVTITGGKLLYGAFSGCSSLTSITIPDSVTSIGYSAFSGCSSLTSITIPNGVTSIGAYTFQDCSSLTSIIIPNGVTSIGDYAFYCSSLKEVYFKGASTSEWNQIEIENGNSDLTSAKLFYYSESQPTDVGNYWHYVDGVPTVW